MSPRERLALIFSKNGEIKSVSMKFDKINKLNYYEIILQGSIFFDEYTIKGLAKHGFKMLSAHPINDWQLKIMVRGI